MARSFSNREAIQLQEDHKGMLAGLTMGMHAAKEYATEVKRATDVLVSKEIYQILKDIPVEELNHDKQGIRVKSLRDAGFTNISEIIAANKRNLSDINGISEDGAFVIKKIAQDIASKAKKDVKIRLTVDNRTQETTALVDALYRYKVTSGLTDRSNQLAKDNFDQIQQAFVDLKPSTGTFRWLFSSSGNKHKAEQAYDTLYNLANGPYGQSARQIMQVLSQLNAADANTAWEDFNRDSIAYITTLEEVCPGILEGEGQVYGLPENLAKEIQEECIFPEGLLCTLRPYQELGVKYALHQERVLLGDEMGLGKTIQAIATMVSLKNTGASHFIVVCPASVITNWCREIKKHSKLSVIKVHGQSRSKALAEWLEVGGVAVTTYETTGIFELEENFKFSLLVVDEAHYIKNPNATRSVNVRNICRHADRMLFMTGTAMENRVEEMISLIEILQPSVAKDIKSMAFMSTAPQFRERIAPVYYRRKREDVLKELPELIQKQQWCIMTPEEEQVYEDTVFDRNFMAIRRVSWNVDDLQYSSKAQRLVEIVKQAKEEERKVIVFSYFLDTIRDIYDLLGDACVEPINGSISPQRRQEIIDEFDAAPAGAVLPAQIQSGGTGLNIQSASVVVICEPQYKPSIENQAISRAYRMGQKRNVLVHRLLCDETVDERILEILEKKQQEFEAFADESVAAQDAIALDEATFGTIIEDEIQRINLKRGITSVQADTETVTSDVSV